MHPPFSMIFFTTLAGAAQGLLLVLFGIQLSTHWRLTQAPPLLFTVGAVVILALSAIGLVAATFHLGRPSRAWRSAAMWRTSWLSREVIVLPAFMAAVAAWGALHWLDTSSTVAGAIAAALALLLYLCTGMIYAAIKAIKEWATPLTPLNYALLGLASGLLLSTALTAWLAPEFTSTLVKLTLCAIAAAALARGATLWRNLRLVPTTTTQTAIGVRHPKVIQKAQGAMGGSFNTREFFHGKTPQAVRTIRWTAVILGFAIPAAALGLGAGSAPALLLALLFVIQWVGMLAERWSFFAEGQHPQNLYYRSRS
ncbi:MAG: DmsC/YnfH family molybdoenzyme membrane anchor subunit [Ottowia sp.]|uniref:dimethyl sulfoxide reductase anchor subunit family protein n=1 Tax=Ottowia sp. TaxID=1898956 RepID=UPI003C76F54A